MRAPRSQRIVLGLLIVSSVASAQESAEPTPSSPAPPATTPEPPAASPPSQPSEPAPDLLRGRAVYRDACESCHGREGNGRGPAAANLVPRPRNFLTGSFKFRSTASGERPLLEDVMRTVSTGIRGTWMPAFEPILSAADLRAVSGYVLSFGPASTEPPERLVPPLSTLKPPADSPRLRERGRQLYLTLQCGQCHGPDGRGDGPAAATAVDDEGLSTAPLDFTVGLYKGGSTPEDVYRTFVTGLDGTPMPSYGDSLPKEDDRWALVQYVRSLSRSPGFFRWLFAPRTPWE